MSYPLCKRRPPRGHTRPGRDSRRPPRRRRPAAAAVVAAALALALPACGGSRAGLIPSANAGPLQSDFEAVSQAAQSGNGDCAATESALGKTQQDFLALPASVDAGLRARLRKGIANLRKVALQMCAQPSPTATTQQTTTRPTPTTTGTTSTPTTTTTTGTTPTTPTTPTTTAPNPGNSGRTPVEEEGEEVGKGKGKGEGEGKGDGEGKVEADGSGGASPGGGG